MADPLEDFDRYDRECAKEEARYPVCDICGDRILDEFYYMVGGIKFHLACAECHSTDSYEDGNDEF